LHIYVDSVHSLPLIGFMGTNSGFLLLNVGDESVFSY
jgi:hypothetical protein